MTFTLVQGVALGLLALAGASAAPAQAQTNDPTCKAVSPETEADDIKIARTWLPMAIAINAIQGACKVHDFLVNVITRQPDPDKVTAEDVFEAAKPSDGTGGDPVFKARVAKLPSAASTPSWNKRPTADPVILPPATAGGQPSLFQPNKPLTGAAPVSATEIQGSGTLLTPDGLKRGTFANGKLNGVGEEINPDGAWRGGTYEAGRNISNMFEVRTLDGKTYLAVGSIVDGQIDGLVERVFADGSRQFEDWENGKLMQVGVRAPKGSSPIAPQTRSKTQMASSDSDTRTPMPAPSSPRPAVTAPTGGGPGRNVRDYDQGYSTRIANPGLPASFYARYSGHDLSQAECNNQATATGWAARLDAMRNNETDTVTLTRAIIASLEGMIVITRQCENIPGAKGAMDGWAAQRAGAIATCRSISTDPAICLRSPF